MTKNIAYSLIACVSAAIGLGGCAGDAFEGGPNGSGGTGTGGSSTGGSSTGGSSTGGGSTTGGTTTTGGSGNVYPQPKRECTEAAECVAVVDTGDPCYSAGCSAPIAASEADMSNNPCLVRWEDRYQSVREDCLPSEPVACPAACAVEPSCFDIGCSSALCEIELIYEDTKCSPDCAKLDSERAAALANARECNSLNVGECSGEVTVLDECGCAQPMNHNRVEEIELAKSTYDAWIAADCNSGIACVECLQPADPVAVCDGSSLTCVWAD